MITFSKYGRLRVKKDKSVEIRCFIAYIEFVLRGFMKISDKVFLSITTFIIAFCLGVIFTFLSLSFLFAKGFISVTETPEYIVNFVCGNSDSCRGIESGE
jgi:hypothetical protein